MHLNPAPVLKSGADLTPYLNHVVLGVDVVIPQEQQAVWPDARAPAVGVLKPGVASSPRMAMAA